jgi:hypothetical protein
VVSPNSTGCRIGRLVLGIHRTVLMNDDDACWHKEAFPRSRVTSK